MFKSKWVQGIEFPGLNLALFIIGMAIVWLSCQNILAMIGAFVASLHIRIAIKEGEMTNKLKDKIYGKSQREAEDSEA